MGVFSFLFSTNELKQLSGVLVKEFADSFPAASKLNSTDKKLQKKYDKAFHRLRCSLVGHLEKNKLSVYNKAKLINMIVIDLEKFGYDKETVDILKKNVTTIISLS
jgi:hypothetical protein